MKKITKKIASLARFILAIGIIWYLLNKMNLPATWGFLINTVNQWPWLLLGFFLFFTCIVLGAIRWKIGLSIQNMDMTWKRVFSIFLIGHFFNAFMFGTTGGDLARIFYAARETQRGKTEATTTIVMDRILGAGALIAITTVMLLFKRDFYMAHPELRTIYYFMWIFIAASISAGILALNLKWLGKFSFAHRILNQQKWNIGDYIKRIYKSFAIYKKHPWKLTLMVAISALAHIIVFVHCLAIGRALGIDLGFIDYFTLVPAIIFASAIPITPGGVGVREYMAVTMLGTMGISKAQAFPLSIMVYFNSLLWSLLSGIVFVCYSTNSGRSALTDLDQIRMEAEEE